MKRNVKTTMANAKSTMLLANTGVMNANNVIITQGKNTDVAPCGVKEQILKISSPIARKEHVCAICGKKILVGERYQSITIVKGNKMETCKRHTYCHETMKVTNDQSFHREVAINTKQLYNSFSYHEQMEIAFFPLVITELAWRYAFKVLDEAAAHKISETVKLSRAVRELRKKYIEDMQIDLDSWHMNNLFESVEEFHTETTIEFTQLYYSVNNEIKRRHADIDYKELKTYAYISLAMIDALRRHNKSMNEVIAKRLSVDTRMRSLLVPPRTSVLGECMEAFLSPVRYENISHVDTAIKIILNKIRQQEFVFYKPKK